MDVVRFINRINRELRTAEESLAEVITEGEVTDYAQYRALVHERRGLRRARAIIAEEAGNALNPDGDTDFNDRLDADF